MTLLTQDEGDEGDEYDDDEVASAITAATGNDAPQGGGMAAMTMTSPTAPFGSPLNDDGRTLHIMDMPDDGESKYTTLRSNTSIISPAGATAAGAATKLDVGKTPAAFMPPPNITSNSIIVNDDDDILTIATATSENEGKDGDDEDEKIDFEKHPQFIIYPDDVIRTDLTPAWNKVRTEVL
jgi:hypothetical protein